MKKIMRSDEQKEETGQKVKNTLFSRLAKKFEGLSMKQREWEAEMERRRGKGLHAGADDEVPKDRLNWLKEHGYISNDFLFYSIE